MMMTMVDCRYKDMGTIIEGKVEQGTVGIGDKLCVMPNRTPVEVRAFDDE